MAILVPTNPRPLLQEEKNLDDNEYGVYIATSKRNFRFDTEMSVHELVA